MIADLEPHAWPLVGLALGVLANIWTSAREMSVARNERVWPHQFIARRPMRCGLSVFGAIGGYFVLIELDMASIGAAFGVGLVSDMLLDTLRGMTKQRLGLDATQESKAVDLSETTILRPKDQ